MIPADVIRDYPHIRRMMAERDELGSRLDKLCIYYDESAGLLTDHQRDLMCKQMRINHDIQYYSK